MYRLISTAAIATLALGTAILGVAHAGNLAFNPAPPHATAGTTPFVACGNKSVLDGGPTTPPKDAIRIGAGNNSQVNWRRPHATYWFAPGVHTLGSGIYDQIQPGAGSTFIGAPGAVIDGQHKNYYAFVGTAPDVTIDYLTISDFGTWGGNFDQGVINGDSTAGWVVSHSTISDNAGAGVMLGSHDTLSYDCIAHNQQYGFNAYSKRGPAGLLLSHNEILGNDTYNWEAKDSGCGCSGGGKFWDVDGAVITGNFVVNNHNVGLWVDTDNRGFDIKYNYFQNNYNAALQYEISYNAVVRHNVFVHNGVGRGPHTAGFPTGAIFISESGSDSRVAGPYGALFAITGNTFINNWSGVILWENSNRFCGSPAVGSTGYCTLVDPRVITAKSCNSKTIAHAPYYADCRWKTKNVLVKYNVFDFSPADLGRSCTAANGCGFVGVFSEYGSYPSWSPYKAYAVPNHITFRQHNKFQENTYNGPWRFMADQLNRAVSWASWRTAYHQDWGSRLTR
jgi:hypothetical protein